MENQIVRKEIDGELVSVDDLIVKHERFIYKTIKPFEAYGRKIGFYREDLYQSACIGMMKAFDKFDSSHDKKFLTYAAYWMKGIIGKEMEKSKPIHIPDYVAKAQKTIKDLGLENADVDYVSEVIGHREDVTAAALIHIKDQLSINVKNEDGNYIHENIPYIESFQDIEEADLMRRIKGITTKKEWRVFVRRMEGKSYKEIGEEFGVTLQAVGMIMKKIRSKLGRMVL